MAKGIINVRCGSKSSQTTRADVKLGEVFIASGKKTIYAHTGTRAVPPSNDKRFQSMNIKTGVEASSANGTAKVEIVGTWNMEVQLHEDYRHLA